jgi:hypothetical protein
MMKVGRSLFALSMLGIANTAYAEVFCVDTAEKLQTALTTAASNNQGDEVRIVQGTYVGNFIYATTTEAYDLAVSGGYTPGCASQDLDPANTILDGNQAGTVLVLAAEVPSVHLRVTGLTLRNGKYAGNGGGLYAAVGDAGTVSIEANTIKDNTASFSRGGGVYVYALEGTVALTSNRIEGNASGDYGGGVHVSSPGGTVALTNNTIVSNTSSLGGGVCFEYGSTAFLKRNLFEGNIGGGVYLKDLTRSAILEDNRFEGNIGNSFGGLYVSVINVSRESVTAINNQIEGNISHGDGGGVYLYTRGNAAVFTNNTVVGNMSSNRGGGLFALFDGDQGAGIELYNNLFWNNTSGNASDLWIDRDYDGNHLPTPISLFSNNFDQTPTTGYAISPPITIDPSNLDNDPLFVNGANGDLHLSAGSPMIDAGYPGTPDLPEFDIEGTPRVLGDSVDIGAYEFDGGSDPRAILSVTKAGSGTGTVTSNPIGITCGTDCAQAFPLDTLVTLAATPTNANSVFDGWSGDPDCADGQVTMDTNKSCTATFSAVRQLTVTKDGMGGGTVTSIPAGIDCGISCSAWYYLNQTVQLSATPDSYSVFSHWSGGADCTDGPVTMSTHLTCTANFDQIYYTLLVILTGTGSGTVTSNPAGIQCEADCREDYPAGTKVTLTATPQQGSTFDGWDGACSGSASTCEVTLLEVTGVTASFTAPSYSVTATAGTGGTASCVPTTVSYNSTSTCTATPNAGYAFAAWSGACSGQDATCTLTGIQADQTSTASFTALNTVVVSITATDPNAAEAGLDTGTFTFSRTGSTSAALTVNYTVSGSAKSGKDYKTLGSSVKFPRGSATVTKTVTPVQDKLVEDDESIVLTLVSGTGYSLGNPSSATVTLTSDD